jgi:hypothetical protein
VVWYAAVTFAACWLACHEPDHISGAALGLAGGVSVFRVGDADRWWWYGNGEMLVNGKHPNLTCLLVTQ